MRFAAIPVLGILIVRAAFACSALPLETQRVSPDLTVVVTHRQKPIAGIEIQVVPEGSSETIYSGVTDRQGTVLIQGLKPGAYFLTASHRDFEAGEVLLEVADSTVAAAKKRLDFQWADSAYQSRRVAGTLTGFVPGDTGNAIMNLVHPRVTLYAGVAITLKNAFSDDEYRTISDSSGLFILEPVPDGIYVLTIDGGMKSVWGTVGPTRQVLDLTQAASRDSLDFQLQPGSSCGPPHLELKEK